MKAGIECFVPSRKYQVKPQCSSWFNPVCLATTAQRNQSSSGSTNLIFCIVTDASLYPVLISVNVSSIRLSPCSLVKWDTVCRTSLLLVITGGVSVKVCWTKVNSQLLHYSFSFKYCHLGMQTWRYSRNIFLNWLLFSQNSITNSLLFLSFQFIGNPLI